MAAGLFRLKNLLRSRAFRGLVVAAIFQVLLVRTTHVADLARMVLPVLNSLTWYWRGSINLLLLYVVVVAAGADLIFSSRRRGLGLVCVCLMILNLGELGWVYSSAGLLAVEKPDLFANTINSEEYFSQPVSPQSKNTGWQVRCWDTLTGYLGEFNHSLAQEGSVFLQGRAINIVDIRAIFGAAGKGGYFKGHTWPFWPASDREELEKFLNFKQIMPIPFRLQIINSVSAILWIGYLTLIFGVGFNRVRSLRMET